MIVRSPLVGAQRRDIAAVRQLVVAGVSATSRDIIAALQGVVAIRYDTTEAFNVDSKAECGRLNLAHVGS